MRLFALFMLWMLRRELQITLSAPVFSTANVERLEKDIEEWEVVLFRCEKKLIN